MNLYFAWVGVSSCFWDGRMEEGDGGCNKLNTPYPYHGGKERKGSRSSKLELLLGGGNGNGNGLGIEIWGYGDMRVIGWSGSGGGKDANAPFVPYQMRKDGEPSIFRSDEEAGLVLCGVRQRQVSAVIYALKFSGALTSSLTAGKRKMPRFLPDLSCTHVCHPYLISKKDNAAAQRTGIFLFFSWGKSLFLHVSYVRCPHGALAVTTRGPLRMNQQGAGGS
jgi:hypothetical protein